MRLTEFDYELPPERIAQRPAEEREAARLLVVGPGEALEHRHVRDLPELLLRGESTPPLLVVNDTRVMPARLLGEKKETGGRVEIFLVRHVGERTIVVGDEGDGEERHVEVWRAMGKSSKPLRFGTDVIVAGRAHALVVHLIGRGDDGLLEVGLSGPRGTSVREMLRAVGHVPLPPYIKRDDDPDDMARYQTVFARVEGAVAAPTAGLHLSHALLGQLAVAGIEVASVTLHVGLGTFQPVTVEDLDDHPMHAEAYDLSQTTARAIAAARARGARVVAVGTTVVRALESAADPETRGLVRAGGGDTRLLIQPGHHFRVVDRLVTNFHLPKSTLLAMVCAFARRERVLEAYRAAVREEYRFYSYGDAMLLTRDDGAAR